MLPSEVRQALLPASEGVTLVITVGNTLRSDDGAGPCIAGAIVEPRRGVRILDAADRPENCIDEAVECRPAKTVIIDAADFQGTPGEVRLIPEDLIPAAPLSTHSFPLPVIAKILAEETGSRVYFIGIQPKSVDFGETLSPEVSAAVLEIIRLLGKKE